MFESLFSRGGLSLDRLRGFLEMAEAGSIAKAAPGDENRQSLISRQIRELEEFFGVELTVRRGKTLGLSAAGERLVVLIREQFRDLQDFQLAQAGHLRSYRMAAGASLLEWLVLPVAGEVRRVLGGASLRLASMRSRQIVEAVRDGEADFGIVRQDALPPGVPQREILRMTFHLCVPVKMVSGVPHAQRDQPATWARWPFAANAGGGQLDRVFRQAMEKACGRFQPAYECDSLLQVKELVCHGLCAGVLGSIGTRGLDPQEVQVRSFAPLADYGRPLVLHWSQRQMRRRGMTEEMIEGVAEALRAGAAIQPI